MRLKRRHLLGAGGGWLAVCSLPFPTARAETAVEIRMAGRADGSRVWFDPAGLHIAPGQSVRWINTDPANSHTASAYHPANGRRPRRIPEKAEPWDSGYLLPGESYSVTLTTPGVYDYFCRPHERAGMVGQIVVGEPAADDWHSRPGIEAELPGPVRERFVPVARILAEGAVPARTD